MRHRARITRLRGAQPYVPTRVILDDQQVLKLVRRRRARLLDKHVVNVQKPVTHVGVEHGRQRNRYTSAGRRQTRDARLNKRLDVSLHIVPHKVLLHSPQGVLDPTVPHGTRVCQGEDLLPQVVRIWNEHLSTFSAQYGGCSMPLRVE